MRYAMPRYAASMLRRPLRYAYAAAACFRSLLRHDAAAAVDTLLRCRSLLLSDACHYAA